MCVATTAYQRTALLQTLRVEPARVRIISNGVDLSAMTGSSVALKPSWHNPGRIHIAVLGYPSKRKNQALLIRAIAVLRETHPNAAGVIVGSPGSPGDEHYLAFLKDLVYQLNLRNEILFVPFNEDKNVLFASVDILASTAVHEGFGRTIIEAMAAGCPVVARRAGGPETIIEHERTGLLVSGDDPVEFAGALRRIIDDPRLRDSLVAAAGRECLARYDATKVAEEYYALFNECLSEPK